MKLGNKRRRISILAGYILAGAVLLQLGPCISMILPLGAAAFDVGALLDENGYLFGLFNLCGRMNIQYVDKDGNPTDGDVLYTEDDLIWDCPVRQVLDPGN